jgi:hypothetical protein
MIGLGSFVIAAAMVAPSFAAKKAVNDEELDMVTAAGQPVIIQTGGPATVTFTPTTDIEVTIQTDAQGALRALVLNNVMGENEVANGVNISGGGAAGSGGQANNITQSWGATADITIVTGKGGAATATAVCPPGTLICKVSATATAGATQRVRLTSAADNIITAETAATVTYSPVMSMSLLMEGGSQDGLVAMVVNNVVGLNQVGNGVNVAGASANVGATGIAITNTPGPGPSGQSNVLGAWRGTPQNFTRLP